MPPEVAGSPLFLAAIVLGALGAVLVLASLVSLVRLRLFRAIFRLLGGLALLAVGATAGGIAIGMAGYHALTREEVAARVAVTPTGPQRFQAAVRLPDGRETRYDLAGDEIYMDARILKWHPYANLIGLHTAYELDRVAGRYRDMKDERTAPRTVHALGRDRPVDLHALRRRHAFLAPLVDAEYGSATFVPATQPAEFEIRVSTTGLLAREVARGEDLKR
jgi:hypothetical protein